MGNISIGDKFGMLTVQTIISERLSNNALSSFVICKCDCGQIQMFRANSLLKGNNKSCGCISKKSQKMRHYENIIGKTFGNLTVIEQIGNSIFVKCKCLCGGETIVEAYKLIGGKVLSCGCLNKSNIVLAVKKHGKSKSKIYKVYTSMLRRCYQEKNKSYHNYGGRGISVCSEWKGEHGFENFYSWALKHGYQEIDSMRCTLDRIDYNGNYTPKNCRWVDMTVQNNNRRDNHLISYKGQTHTIAQWARILDVNVHTLQSRIARGWTDEEIIGRPFRKNVGGRYVWQTNKNLM